MRIDQHKGVVLTGRGDGKWDVWHADLQEIFETEAAARKEANYRMVNPQDADKIPMWSVFSGIPD
jgi:hypothetical protein